METPAIYGSTTDIRPECLLPFSEGWQQPTPNEVRALLKMADLTGSEAGRLVGMADSRTIRRWVGGDTPIPFAAWAIIYHLATGQAIWKRPTGPAYDSRLVDADGEEYAAVRMSGETKWTEPTGEPGSGHLTYYKLRDGGQVIEQPDGTLRNSRGKQFRLVPRTS